MQMTKKQHYLPQFYLDNFKDNSGKLWVYDRLEGNIFTSSPRDIACKNYLYETRWENANPKLGAFVLPNQIEKQFAEQEGKYSKLLKKIINICTDTQNGKALICYRDDKEILASFVSNILLRNPWSMKQADLDCVTDGIMEVKEIIEINKMLQLMDWGGTESLVKFCGKKIWLDEDINGGMQQEFKKILQCMKFCFITSKNDKFVTSSFPVLNGIDETSDENEEIIYFPLHPRIAILYGNSLPRKASNRVIPLDEANIDFLNKKYIKLDDKQIRFIYANDKKILDCFM